MRRSALQNLGGARRFLERHHRHADEAIGVLSYQVIHALVVKFRSGFAMRAAEPVAETVGIRFQSSHLNLALIHDFEMSLDIENRRLQSMRLAAGEGKRVTASHFRYRDAEDSPWRRVSSISVGRFPA